MPKYVKNSLIKTNYFSYLQNLDHDLRQQQHTGKVQKWSNSISVQSSNCFLLKWFRCRALKFSSATDRVSSATIHEKSDNTERHRPMLNEGASARSRLSRHLCTQQCCQASRGTRARLSQLPNHADTLPIKNSAISLIFCNFLPVLSKIVWFFWIFLSIDSEGIFDVGWCRTRVWKLRFWRVFAKIDFEALTAIEF